MPRFILVRHNPMDRCGEPCDWCNLIANHFRKAHPPVKGVPPRSR